jgi:hypothetical protein
MQHSDSVHVAGRSIATVRMADTRNLHGHSYGGEKMKIVRNTLLAAAGVLALSLTANAAGTTSVTNGPSIKSSATVPMQFAQKKEDPSAGSVGVKKKAKPKAKKEKKKDM